jgi:hypothetical protein
MLIIDKPALTRNQRLLRLALVGLTGGMLSLSWLYTQGWESQIIHCYFQETFGFIGPGCGLTRSAIFFLNGQWMMSIKYHLFGPIIYLFSAFCLGWGLISLFSNQSLTLNLNANKQGTLLSLATITFTGGFLGYYGLRCLALYSDSLATQVLQELPVWSFLKAGAALL